MPSQHESALSIPASQLREICAAQLAIMSVRLNSNFCSNPDGLQPETWAQPRSSLNGPQQQAHCILL